MEKVDENYKVPNLEKGIAVLEYLSLRSAGETLQDIKSALDISQTTAYRILNTLVRLEYLNFSEDTKRYKLSRKLLTLGFRSLNEHNLLETVLPHLRDLRDQVKETACFGVLGDEKGIFIEQAQGHHTFRFVLSPGKPFELHCSAPGKAIMAYLPKTVRDRYLSYMTFTRYNTRTITSREAYLEELERVGKLGYAMDNEEELSGVICVGAPIFNYTGYPCGAIWISGPKDRLSKEVVKNTVKTIKEVTGLISNEIRNTKYTMNTRKYLIKNSLVACLVGCCVSLASAGNPPFFTTDAVLNAKGELLMTQKGTRHLDIFSADGKSLLHSFPFDEIPTGLLPDGDKVYVTTFEKTGRLQVLSLESGRVEAAIPTGSGACHPMFGPDKKHIYVCNQFDNSVVEVDPVMRKVVRSVKVLREPKSAVFSKDGKYMFVTNFLPSQRADVDVVAACVSVIEMDGFTKVKDIQLANGSNALRGMCITPDGKYIYVSHNLGRFTVPTSQLQQGWMNTSAFSVIDVAKQEFVGAVLVDEPDRGAAGIWSIACDDKHIFITHSGTHEVSVIDHPAMLAKFESYKDKSRLDYDLNFLYGLRERVPLQGNGPRNFIFSGDKLIIPTYFADILNTVDINTLEVTATDMNPGRTETPENKGEKYFNNANHCYQGWQSCNGCHPGDARTDGMNWDLMNDGVGNSKNCKSMLYSHVTPPSMISGVRESAEYAVRAGFKFIQFFEPEEEMAKCVDAYMKSLRPVPSPYLVNGELSDKAKEGRKVFEKLKCGECHSGPYYTDMKMHRIGEDIEFEKGWDTPTLIEVWRTAPYLFDGRAATMEEVFEVHKHGIDKKVSKKDVEALTEYVNSL